MIRKKIKRLFDEKFEIAPFGVANSGNNLLLLWITKMQGFLNIAGTWETGAVWRF